MSFSDREEKILNILYEKDAVRSSELAKILYVSVSTLRRDLEKLQEKGLIVREHGICKLGNKLKSEKVSYSLRERQYDDAKNHIAREAAERVNDGDNIMLDGSSSAYHVVHHLGKFRNLLVITNNAKASVALKELNIDNISTGGRMGHKTISFVGQEAINSVQNYNADILFFSCAGITEDGYLTDVDKDEVDVRKEMMKHCDKKIALVDSSKFGKKFLYNLCHVSEVSEIISEEELPTYIMRYMKK